MKKIKAANMKGAALTQAMPADPEPDENDNYEVKGHLQTLVDAHGIMNDPVKMKKVHKLAGRHANAIAGIKSMGIGGGMGDDGFKAGSTDDLVKYKNAKFGKE